MNVVDRAMVLAFRGHHGQTNKHDGLPYILHPHRVAVSLRDAGLGEIFQAVGWLHDVLEDTQITADDIIREFHDEPLIITAVTLLTKVKGVSNEEYYHGLTHNHIAATVKWYDLHDNFRRNHLIEDPDTRLRMGKKYSQGVDILQGVVLGSVLT